MMMIDRVHISRPVHMNAIDNYSPCSLRISQPQRLNKFHLNKIKTISPFASTSDVIFFNVEKTFAHLCVCFCVQIFPPTRARKVQRIPLLGEIAVYCLTVYLCKKGPTEIADYLLFLYL